MADAPPQCQADCYAILNEALNLIRTFPRTIESQKRLCLILLQYFQEDHVASAHFRSMICYGQTGTSVSMEELNKYVIIPSSSYEYCLGGPVSHAPIQFQAINSDIRRQLRASTLAQAHQSIKFLLDHIILHHERKADLEYYCTSRDVPLKWFNAILGITDRSETKSIHIPQLEELRLRVEKSLTYSFLAKADQPMSHFFSPASGLAWSAPDDAVDFEELYLVSCSKFPGHLSTLLQKEDVYLDELAGADVPYFDPLVAARFQAMYDQSPSHHVEGINLMRGPDGTKLGGTVLALHQYLSPRFLAYYTMDQNSCSYMEDIRSSHKKDRKVRIASMHHDNSKPIWLQFGATSDVFLYLSQTASVGEQLWLKVVNYLTQLLSAFVNSELKGGVFGKRVPRNKLVSLPVFTELVLNASVPKDGNFGPHDDDKPGLSHAADPRYSRSNLVVPTLCIQNYAQATTSISWAPKDDPTHTTGVVFQECALVHCQLLYVQEYFIHWVRLQFRLFDYCVKVFE
jgi:hypothetical protein